MATTNFPPEPGGVEIQKVERSAAIGTSEDSEKTLKQLLSNYPEEDATQVEEELEPESHHVTTQVRPAIRTPSHMNLFQHPDAHPFVLDLALMRKYGPEWLGWESRVLEAKIRLDFSTQSISDLNVDKIQAVKTLHLVDTFWDEWLVFVPCAMALSGFHADFRVLNALTVPQAMIAVDVAAKLRSDSVYSLEVRTFLEVVHLHDGMVVPIEPLTDIVSVDTSRYGVNVDKVRERWDSVRESKQEPKGMTPEDVQLQRMLAAHLALEDNRRQLRDQLPLLYHD